MSICDIVEWLRIARILHVRSVYYYLHPTLLFLLLYLAIKISLEKCRMNFQKNFTRCGLFVFVAVWGMYVMLKRGWVVNRYQSLIGCVICNSEIGVRHHCFTNNFKNSFSRYLYAIIFHWTFSRCLYVMILIYYFAVMENWQSIYRGNVRVLFMRSSKMYVIMCNKNGNSTCALNLGNLQLW